MLRRDKLTLEGELEQMKDKVAKLEKEGEVLRQVATDRSEAEQRVKADSLRAAELERR